MFSIIIPMYNSERFLNQCFQSIDQQHYMNYEVICVDDNSNDSTAEIVRKKCSEDNRYQYIKKETHTNAGDARNLGLSYATGDYVLFLDSDDYLHENILSVLREEIERTAADITVFQYKLYYQNLKRESIPAFGVHINKKSIFCLNQLKTRKFEFTNIAVWNKLYKRSFIEQHSLRFKSYPALNDVYFSWRSLISASSISLCKQIGVYYRVNQNTATSDKLIDNSKIFIDAFLDIYYYLVKMRIWEMYRFDFISATYRQIEEFESRLKKISQSQTNFNYYKKRKQFLDELINKGDINEQ